MNSVVKVSNLEKCYGPIRAVDGISFEVKTDEIFALIGPNGAGKSTALRMLATLLKPTNGGAEIYGLDIEKDAAKIRRLISYLPEEAGAYKNMTGLGYLNFMAALFSDGQKQRDFVQKGEEIANLGNRIRDKIGTYSKGMTRKLLLARTVMIKPKLAILDEPTSGLDVVNALEIRNRIKQLAKEGMAVLLSSHNMLEIEYLSDRVAIIAKGKIHEIGSPQELKEKYKAQNLEEVFCETDAMKKFFVLLQKEVREMLTLRTLAPLLIVVVVFYIIGQVASKQAQKTASAGEPIAVLDEDNSALSKSLIEKLKSANFEVTTSTNISESDFIKNTETNKEIFAALEIPAGFQSKIQEGQTVQIKTFSFFGNDFSVLAPKKYSQTSTIAGIINGQVSDLVIANKLPNINPAQIKNPVTNQEFVVSGEKMVEGTGIEVIQFLASKMYFVPVLLFILIVFAAQMIATAIASEKENKTLETLLTAPISRSSIVTAKMLGAGIVSLVFAGVYILGFRSFNSGVSAAAGSAKVADLAKTLGIVFTPVDYLLFGLSLFAGILCALSIAIILGAFAEDVKSVQSVIAPLMALLIIPYFVFTFLDINTLPFVFRYLLYAIPFSHVFLVMPNLYLHNNLFVIYGIIYQTALFAIFVAIAARIFSTDQILTMRLSLRRRK